MNHVEYNLEGVDLINFINKKNERLIKIINVSNQSKLVELYYYYPSIFFPYYKFEKRLEPGEWIIPNVRDLRPCGFIIAHIDEKINGKITLLSERNYKRVVDKVICVGLNKTGTTSITENMKKLGYETWGGEYDENSLKFSHYGFSNNAFGVVLDLVEKTDVDFFQDIPFSYPGISEKIIKMFPQSKYILSVRQDPDTWVRSVKRFWKQYFEGNKFTPNAYKWAENFVLDRGHIPELSYLLTLFESWNMDQYEGDLDEKLRQVYINHNQSVKNTLITNNCDWIEIDVSKKGELKKLTTWLNINNEEEDFVWVNKTKG
jgi:hypothetical protein